MLHIICINNVTYPGYDILVQVYYVNIFSEGTLVEEHLYTFDAL